MSRRKLKTPNLDGARVITFCGAFSLMAITGKTQDQIHRLIRKANNWPKSKRVAGLYARELRRAMDTAGIKYKQFNYWNPNPTLARWIDERQGTDKRAMFIVELTEHYVVVNNNEFIDTHTRVPVKLDDCPHRRARVQRAFRIGG